MGFYGWLSAQALDRPDAYESSAEPHEAATPTTISLDVEAPNGDVDATPPETTLLAGRLDANDVWRMVDQDPPATKMPTLSFDEVTGEFPALNDPQAGGFRSTGDDLR